MTNIKENTTSTNMQTHIEKAFKIIDEFLPFPYVDRVLEILPEPKPAKGYIRNVRARVTPNHDNRIDIINALVEVSLENKKQMKKLQELTSKD